MDFITKLPLINLIVLLVFIIILVCIIGYIIKDKKLKIGNTELIAAKEDKLKKDTRIGEREIIKRQIHIARAVCSNFKYKVPNYEIRDKNLVENICYKVSDEIEDLILFNHLSTDKDYINSRFPIVWDVISSNLSEGYTSEDYKQLKETSYDGFSKLIELLLNVRKENE